MPTELDASQRLHRAVIAASERCHREIAESVHGTLCQTLGGAGLMTKVLAEGMKAGQPVNSSQLESLAETLDRALDEARHVLTQLQPVAPGKDGLMTALARLASQTNVGQTTCTFKCEKAVLIDDSEAALSLYRVAEGALRTAIQNPGPHHIKILLIERTDAITLTVTDDGQILAPRTAGDAVMQVEIMRCRVQAAGGKFTAESKPGTGTSVKFTLPQSASRT